MFLPFSSLSLSPLALRDDRVVRSLPLYGVWLGETRDREEEEGDR